MPSHRSIVSSPTFLTREMIDCLRLFGGFGLRLLLLFDLLKIRWTPVEHHRLPVSHLSRFLVYFVAVRCSL
ncbi:hypothetical protein AAHA92_10275 [Salvia divinorum]|uniref:Uncharacterized protein n=1 Tax=Salvia divinorum TaxID=28513 RepID=A0ABD1HXJ3_SALDI